MSKEPAKGFITLAFFKHVTWHEKSVWILKCNEYARDRLFVQMLKYGMEDSQWKRKQNTTVHYVKFTIPLLNEIVECV